MFEILERAEMAQGTVVMNVIRAPKIAAKARPGQFVILRANETGERIPLTMADTDQALGTITIIYQVVGKSTELFKTLKAGDAYTDVLGPLGQPTHVEKTEGLVICIGGGTGTAVVHPITRGYKNSGNEVIAIIGARTKDLLILEDKMAAASNELKVCTDDGSYGHHGFVSDILQQYIDSSRKIATVVAAGPVPMMKAIANMTRPHNIHTLVSLNSIMIDGTGMCGGCRVSVGGKNQFTCVDGPEFDGHQVDFDGLMQRLAAYRDEEARARQEFDHTCKLARN
jgi:ferredoxin--NADP+ reductase